MKGLAAFAQAHGNEFVRIESIAEVDGVLRVLDLLREDGGALVGSFSGAQAISLYEDGWAAIYK